ncbi:MFS transporter, partial [Streptomyces californicus]
GYSPLHAGIACIPFTIGIGVGGALASKAALLVPPRWLLTGAALVLSGALLFGSTLDRHIGYFTTLLPLLVVIGFGVGVAMVLAPLCVLVDVPPSDIGPLSAVGQMFMNLATPIAIGLLSPIAASRTLSLGGSPDTKVSAMTGPQLDALTSGYTTVLLVCSGLALLAAVVALTLRFTPAQLAQAQHAQEEAQKA